MSITIEPVAPRVGLTQIQAVAALALHGPNSIAETHERPTLLAWVIRVITDPMAVLLMVAAVTYVLVGDRADAIISTIALLPIVAVSVILEGRADAALAKLRALSAPRPARGRYRGRRCAADRGTRLDRRIGA